jgi:hypothetical protein
MSNSPYGPHTDLILNMVCGQAWRRGFFLLSLMNGECSSLRAVRAQVLCPCTPAYSIRMRTRGMGMQYGTF